MEISRQISPSRLDDIIGDLRPLDTADVKECVCTTDVQSSPPVPDSYELVLHQSPIGMLPEELFETIIRLAINRNSTSYQSQDLQPLRLVSRRWRQVIDSLPRFWYTIRSDVPHQWITQSLTKAQETPLTIRWFIPSRELPETLAYRRAVDAMAILTPHVTRWNKLSVRFHGTNAASSHAEELHTFAMSNVKYLVLSGRVNDAIRWDDLGGHPPKLESIYLKRYCVPWDSKMFFSGTMKHLALVRMRWNGPTWEQFCRILSCSPELVSLELECPFMRRFDPSEGQVVVYDDLTKMVTLPKLTKATIKLIPSDLVHFFDRLHIPACTRLRIYAEPFITSQSPHFQILLERLAPRIADLRTKCTRLNITVHDNHFRITSDTGFLNIGLPYTLHGFSHLPQLVSKLTASFREPGPPPPEVTIDWRPRSPQRGMGGIEGLEPCCHQLVSAITMSMEDELTRRTLRYLAEPLVGVEVEGVGARSGWPFPKLRRVEVAYSMETMEDVVAFVQTRCRKAGDDTNGADGAVDYVESVRVVATTTTDGEQPDPPCDAILGLERDYPQVRRKEALDPIED